MNLLDVLRSIAPQSVIACLQAKLQAGLPVTLEDLQGQLEKYTDGLAREMGVVGAAVDALQGGMDAALEDLQGYRAQLDALGGTWPRWDRAVQENQSGIVQCLHTMRTEARREDNTALLAQLRELEDALGQSGEEGVGKRLMELLGHAMTLHGAATAVAPYVAPLLAMLSGA